MTIRKLALLPLFALVALAAASATAAPPRGEGKLELLTWEGYAQRQWVVPFERSTGCSVSARYASSSTEMAQLMRERGRFDLVSASGDIARLLVVDRSVRALDPTRVRAVRNFFAPLQSPVSAGGKQYGVATLWGPNLLMYDPAKVSPAPRSWAVLYDERYRGRVTIPNNALQIADAALYLGVRDPFELTKPRLNAAIALLRRQRPLVRSYWGQATDEVRLFEDGLAWLGSGWSWQVDRLRERDVAVRAVVPREGATAWLDSWMLGAAAPHPRCAYAWLNWISQPAVQAELARDFGGTPVNRLACARVKCDFVDDIGRMRFWKTPVRDCGDGRKTCMDYAVWLAAWQRVIR